MPLIQHRIPMNDVLGKQLEYPLWIVLESNRGSMRRGRAWRVPVGELGRRVTMFRILVGSKRMG